MNAKLHYIKIGKDGVPEVKVQIEDETIVLHTDPVEVAEVVRCYTCKKEGTEDCPMVHRDKFFGNLWSESNAMDFCSRGERKDESDT